MTDTKDFPRDSRECSVCKTCRANPCSREDCAIIQAALAKLAAADDKPVAYQFQDRDGKWHGFIDDQHYQNTVADGSWPIRALYTSPSPATHTPVQEGDGSASATPALTAMSDEQIYAFWINRDCMDAIRAGDVRGQFVSAVRAIIAALNKAGGA